MISIRARHALLCFVHDLAPVYLSSCLHTNLAGHFARPTLDLSIPRIRLETFGRRSFPSPQTPLFGMAFLHLLAQRSWYTPFDVDISLSEMPIITIYPFVFSPPHSHRSFPSCFCIPNWCILVYVCCACLYSVVKATLQTTLQTPLPHTFVKRIELASALYKFYYYWCTVVLTRF